jgi:hypothetical protein
MKQFNKAISEERGAASIVETTLCLARSSDLYRRHRQGKGYEKGILNTIQFNLLKSELMPVGCYRYHAFKIVHMCIQSAE